MRRARMFASEIVTSDSFLDMPVSARDLYIQLGMRCDDDGFVSPRSVMRMLGAADDDLKVLIAKAFVIPFDTGVVVVRHWKVNNYIRKDIYHPTVHQLEASHLKVSLGSKVYEPKGFALGSLISTVIPPEALKPLLQTSAAEKAPTIPEIAKEHTIDENSSDIYY